SSRGFARKLAHPVARETNRHVVGHRIGSRAHGDGSVSEDLVITLSYEENVMFTLAVLLRSSLACEATSVATTAMLAPDSRLLVAAA
ncbi:hypothetical protein, partial [Mycobacterium avium]|uniref:hypothetical protein n=1 Tax=Mycobacterium avium TaxID=1764 RepID=UPI001E4FDF36